jgi:hypothetical protein
LNKVFDAGYTIISLPFRFTFNHWSVTISLVKEQYVIRREIVKEVRNLGYDYNVYLKDSKDSFESSLPLGRGASK